MATGLQPPPAFDCDISGGSTNATRWQIWTRRFKIYLSALAITEPKIQISTFLHVVGERVEEIYNVNVPAEIKTLNDAIKVITDYFAPAKNTDEQIIKFRNMRQLNGEGIDAFVTRLKTQALICEFKDTDTEVKLQLISGSLSDLIRQKACKEVVPLQDLIKFARSLEHTRVNNYVDNNKPNTINQLFGGHNNYNNHNAKKSEKYKICGLCGYEYPHTGICPARGKTCKSCGKLNHFAKCCRSKTSKTLPYDNRSIIHNNQRPNLTHTKSENTRNQVNRRQYINQLEARGSTQTEEINENQSNMQYDLGENQLCSDHNEQDDQIYSIYSLKSDKYQCPRVNVTICNTTISMGIDSQASINAITWNTYNKLKDKPELISDKSFTYAYNSTSPLRSKGKFITNIMVNNKSLYTEVRVFEDGRDNLLSFESSVKLSLIHMAFAISNIKDSFHQMIVNKYPRLFNGRIGKLKNYEVKLHINKSIKPKVQVIRRIPIHLKDKVALALEEMKRDDIIEEAVGPTPWVSEMVPVPKTSNPDELRMVLDAREINEAIERERHNTPTTDDLISDFNNAKVISKLDFKGGYHQIVIAEESRYITTFRTHMGLMRYKRLTMGICSAAEQFQHAIELLLSGLEGQKNTSDDIFVFGPSYEEHDKNLFAVLDRLDESGLTVNGDKCEFRKTSLEFFGLQFSDKGIAITQSKVKALKEADPPKNQSELRSFLGLATYCSRAIPRFAEKSDLLWKLSRQKVRWSWTADHDKQFNSIKQSIIETSLAYFNKEWNTNLEVDASPVGTAAILYQTNPVDDQEFKVVTFWSQVFSEVERRYSQVEKEALAVVLACEKFRFYLIGQKFNLITDNKAVELILKNPRSKPPARIERWNLRLLEYDFVITHKPGKYNIADYLSRNPIESECINHQTKVAEQYIHFIQSENAPRAFGPNELMEATVNDSILAKVKKCMETNEFDDDPETRPYKNIRDELSISPNGILLRGSRIIIPQLLQTRSIQLAHEGHQGITKTKRLLRERVWFPGIDNMVEQQLNECNTCQLNNKGNAHQPLVATAFPEAAWEQLAIDFHGPLPNGHELMVITDEHSRFPIVNEVNSTSASNVLPKLETIISLMGIPVSIKSDNGPPFNGIEFKQFCEYFGIFHKKITPYWPQANGQCENFNKNIKKIIKNAINTNTSWQSELNAFLRAYRSTPHSSTNTPPSSLIFVNSNTSRLPKLINDISENKNTSIEIAKLNDKIAKTKMKFYHDTRNKVRSTKFEVGDVVLFDQSKNKKLGNKYDNQFANEQYIIKHVMGSMITAENTKGHIITRNSSYFKHYNNYGNQKESSVTGIYIPEIATSKALNYQDRVNMQVPNNNQERPSTNSNNGELPAITEERTNTRPQRERKMPAKYNDYVLDK